MANFFGTTLPGRKRILFLKSIQPSQASPATNNIFLWIGSLGRLSFELPFMPALLCLTYFNLRTQRLFDQYCFDSNYIQYSILSVSNAASLLPLSQTHTATKCPGCLLVT